MRNLRNIRYEQWDRPAQFQERSLTAAAWDLSNDSNFLCTFGPSEENALIELVRVDLNSKSQYINPQSQYQIQRLILFQSLYPNYIVGCTMPES